MAGGTIATMVVMMATMSAVSIENP